MAFNAERFHVAAATPRGMELLARSSELQEALRLFLAAEEPFKARIPGCQLINAGRYGFTFWVAGYAVKVTSPTSSQESFDKRMPLPPENLRVQYDVLSVLWTFLRDNTAGVTAPEQFFVVQAPGDVFILVQQFMRGWVSVEKRTHEYYENSDGADHEHIRKEIKAWTQAVRNRLSTALTGFPLAHMLDDLALERESGVHGGNLLVPAGAMFDEFTPLCIIDQPGHELRKSKLAQRSS